MKKLILLMSLLGFIATTTGCSRIVVVKKDNGKHKGWFKNRHNPHHPNSDNPGHSKKNPGKGNKKFIELHMLELS